MVPDLVSSSRPASVSAAVFVLSAIAVACGSPLGPGGEPRVEPVPRPDVVRGIYVNARAAGSELSELLALADTTGLNTFVIDIKERGEVGYSSTVPLVTAVGAERPYIDDLHHLLSRLRDHGIYPIARIVCFSDPILAEARPEWSIRTPDGGLWTDPLTDETWVDPYDPDVWGYNIDLAREALSAGFAEIQWDYVRFPDVADSLRSDMVFPARAGRSFSEAIREFITLSRRELAAFDVPITADVFGRVIAETDDSNIGQDWDDLVGILDVLLPMVYPALYTPGYYGLPDPSAEPYRLVRTAMDSAVARLNATPGATASLRPWLQAFTQGSTTYGRAEMLDQIRAVEDAGLQEWLFWHPESVYPEGVF